MGPSLRAAFVRIDSPEPSIPAEAMIESSIGELRTLGACWDSDEELPQPPAARINDGEPGFSV